LSLILVLSTELPLAADDCGVILARTVSSFSARSSARINKLAVTNTSIIAAWIGHKDASLTMRLYVHSQDDALKAAGATLDRVMTSFDVDTG
jgi:integrase